MEIEREMMSGSKEVIGRIEVGIVNLKAVEVAPQSKRELSIMGIAATNEEVKGIGVQERIFTAKRPG